MSSKRHKRKSVSHRPLYDAFKIRPSTSVGVGQALNINKLRLPNIDNGEAYINNKEEEHPRTAPTSHRRRVMAKSMEKSR